MIIDKNYYPGWVRKAITFSNDDGNLAMDAKFIEILKPYGILGTFNLCDMKDGKDADFYRDFYRGYGISNHCSLHPLAMSDKVEYKFCDEPFEQESAKTGYVYQHPTMDGFFMMEKEGGVWRRAASTEKYIELVAQAQDVLEEIFGKESVPSYVWPFYEQNNDTVKEYLRNNFRAVRKTGTRGANGGFPLPEDRYAWTYNAVHTNLLEIAELYEAKEDDGNLKFFCFGLHSVDYEHGAKWEDLAEFARKYGNRPEDFYYADVDTIFDYEDAINSLVVNENSIENPTDITLYVKVDGKRVTVPARSAISV